MSSEFEGSPKTWPPLGMPIGSVRALLTLIVMAVVVTRIVRELPIDVLWIQTLLIALAHYFTSRRFVSLPPDVVARLEQDGVVENERHPLFLPKNSIRTLIVLAFAGMAAYLHYKERLFTNVQALTLLGIVFAYLLGTVTRTVGGWINRRSTSPPSGTWGDIKAMTVLIVLILAAIPEFLDLQFGLPAVFHQIALGLMLFYGVSLLVNLFGGSVSFLRSATRSRSLPSRSGCCRSRPAARPSRMRGEGGGADASPVHPMS